MTRVLHEQGYIRKYKFVAEEGYQGSIKIALKYDRDTKTPAITTIQRISKPGLRKYAKVKNMPRVKNGLGVVLTSTPNGVMTSKEAQRQNVGGEVLCYVY